MDYKIQQLSLLHETESDFLKGILILDQENQVHVIPKESANLAHKMYLYTADKAKGTLSGFCINFNDKVNGTIRNGKTCCDDDGVIQ